MKMKKYIYAFSIVTATLIVGCGEGSSVSDTQFSYDSSSIFGFSKAVTYEDYVVKVYDDEIVEANISAPNCQSYEEKGNGVYLLKDCLGKPLYIQAKNGKIQTEDGNVTQEFPLLLNTSKSEIDEFIVTPLTTILATASNKNITNLANTLGVDPEELFKVNNQTIKDLLPKINTILILSASQGAITNKVKFLEVVRDEIINDIYNNNGELNISKVLANIKTKSTENPKLFGLVIIDDNEINETDPLQTIIKTQQSDTIKFYGLVFDGKIANANITIKNLDNNKQYNIPANSDTDGAWKLELNTSTDLYNLIMNEDHLLQFIATKTEVNKTIKLTSTITTKKLRELINKSKIISPSKENRLIISNITTAQDAILDKKNALNSRSYEGNLSELRVYYQDKILETAAIIKAVVDYNVSMVEANNTYELAKNIINIDNGNEANITIDYHNYVVEINETTIENNITSIKNDTILSSQLNMIDTNKKDKFQEVAKNAGSIFYRLLAYYNNNEFIREYTKIVTYPSHYETMTCYLEGNSTEDWNCSSPTIIDDKSNFSLGYYKIVDGNITTTYSLDFNNSIYVEDLNKNYNYYGVIKTEENISSGIIATEPMILVDNFDVVDAFRRLPEESKKDFKKLQNIVKGYTRKEVNYELNRWVKSFMGDVEKYFDENETN